MGFRPEPTIYKLVFEEDTGLAGLHVRAKCCTMGEFNQMLRGSQDPIMDGSIPDITDIASMKAAAEKVREYSNSAAIANEQAIEMFLKYLVEWDLEGRDGQIVPLTLEGLLGVEKPVISSIISAWHMAMMAVSIPLKQQSINGGRLEEATLELGSISESLPNWPKPN